MSSFQCCRTKRRLPRCCSPVSPNSTINGLQSTINTMANYTQPIQNLMNELSRLPGIGMRSAERIAFHLLKQRPEEAMKLANAISDVKTKIRHCSICYNLTEQDPCEICGDETRDQGLVCIVEQPKDL